MRRSSRGQALAELALVLPVFVLLLLAVFDVGRLVFAYNGLTNAAREAARLAIVNQDVTSVFDRAQAMSFGVGLTTAPADAVRFYRSGPNEADVTANEPCDNSDATHRIAVGCIAVVSIDTSWTPIAPLVGNVVGAMDLNAHSELPIEFVCPNAAFPQYQTVDQCPKQP